MNSDYIFSKYYVIFGLAIFILGFGATELIGDMVDPDERTRDISGDSEW